ncbi:U3 small nucleolar RNA-associated protein 6 homolog [Hetaerina americana]|uniref:U3 small nucleolar RNA-associated protein 6 homolog n=1 Tax=Hetaerina americana TaxID=62018 RepID=UPI003A7F4F59
MAEFVEYRTEEMIPELELMEKIQLFDRQEVKNIIKKRKEFQYQIQRLAKTKEDYLRIVHYEMDILQLIRTRREKLGIFSNKSEIDYTIANRVNTLFKQTCLKFVKDYNLCKDYINFCQKMRFNASVGHTLDIMLRVHGQNYEGLWKFASQWEMKEGHSMENARKYLLHGLRFHPESKVLYAEAFRFELKYAQILRQKKHKAEENTSQAEAGGERAATPAATTNALDNVLEPESLLEVMGLLGNIGVAEEAARDEVMEGKLAMLMYDSAVKKVKEVGFIINLLSIAKEYDFTQHLQEKITHDLLNYFPNEELTWDTMARRELEGLSYSPLAIAPNAAISTKGSGSTPSTGVNILGAMSSDTPSTDNPAVLPQTPSKTTTAGSKKKPLKKRIRSCCLVYDAAVKKLDTEKMWRLYIECLLELLGNSSHGRSKENGAEGNTGKSGSMPTNFLPCFTKKLVIEAFRAAHKARKMTEKYYLMWVDMLQGDNSQNAALIALSSKAGTGKQKKGAKGAKGKGKAGASNAGGAGRARKKVALGQNKKVARILAGATERLPKSVELWMMRLRHHMCHGGIGAGTAANKGNKSTDTNGMDVDAPSASQATANGQTNKTPATELVFAQASSQLGDVADAVPIWKVMLHYTQAKGDTIRVESLFQDALKRGPAIALPFKPLYLEWLVLAKGIADARKVYDRISVQPPLCLELHTKMVQLEGMQPKVNLKHARKCFELACDQFGKSKTDVWMEYIKFEMHKGCPENITQIYQRAQETLDDLKSDSFVSEFNILKTFMGAALTPSNGGVNQMQNNSIIGGPTPMVLG